MKKSPLIVLGILALAAIPGSAQTVASSACVAAKAVRSLDFNSLPRPAGDVDKKLHSIDPAAPLLLQARRASKTSLRAGAPLTASVSVEGMGESQAYFEENFNDGAIPAGWVIAPTQEVTWKVSLPTGAKVFAEDPDDGGSLVQDTPYQVFKREKSWAVTPAFTVGANALFEAWIGFSLNYEDECSMKIQVSDDDFATFTDLWFSREQTGEKPWQWRKVQASMAAFAGKTVKLRFFYGSGTSDEVFDAGGYSGDYRIDNIRVSGPGTVESVAVTTGERIRFIADTDADAESWQWSFPGGVPATSTEASPEVYYTADGEYDVTLTVTRGDQTATDTRVGFIKVTGTEPVAAIGYPATFRHYEQGRLPLVAPMVPVTFSDASAGFPDSWHWEFAGVDPDNTVLTTADTREASVGYSFLHEHPVALTVSNSHGTSEAFGSVVAEYGGNITNLRPGERGTVFDLEGAGTFPGSNTMGITAYAEKFSAPSRPMRVYGAYVFFTKALASSAYYQMQTITVRLCKADENGLPGEALDFGFWDVYELEVGDSNGAVATGFQFTDEPVVDSDFFIVVEGIPELVDNADEQCDVRMAMAPFRSEGNTAFMLKNGKWGNVAEYFPAPANHTSYMILANMAHSVISNVPGTDNDFTVNQNAGELTLQLFSYMGWDKEKSTCSAPWLHIASEPGEMTVDEVKVAYDALPGQTARSGEITLTDGITSHTFIVTQEYQSGLNVSEAAQSIDYDRASALLTARDAIRVYNASGAEVAGSADGTLSVAHLAAGVYMARSGEATLKFTR